VFSLINFSCRKLAATVQNNTTLPPSHCSLSELEFTLSVYFMIIHRAQPCPVCPKHRLSRIFISPFTHLLFSVRPSEWRISIRLLHFWLISSGSNFEMCVQKLPSSNICFPHGIYMSCHVFSQFPKFYLATVNGQSFSNGSQFRVSNSLPP
jgi:disulfide bond formation protein DsbB